jgi:hypothetical protein
MLGVSYLAVALAVFSFASLVTPPEANIDKHDDAAASRFDTRKLGFTAPHFFFKLQSDNGIRKTEDANFTGAKSNTQWWYFDCILDDGSLLVVMFSPMQWWSESEAMPTHKAIVYVSYLPTGGAAIVSTKAFDAGDVCYTDSTVSCSVFSLKRRHTKGTRRYDLDFKLDNVHGSLSIASTTNAFSPFPGGLVGRFIAKNLLKLGGDDPVFRYAAHVPHGHAKCDLNVRGKSIKQSGTAYHEQGMFRGAPDQLGKGWAWVHFVSKNFNVFGKPQDFVCLEKNGRKKISGTTFFDRGMVLSNTTYSASQQNLLIGGTLSLESDNVSFTVEATAAATPLIVIPSARTPQLWGTVAQPSVIRYTENGKTIEEEGVLLLETCKMGGS